MKLLRKDAGVTAEARTQQAKTKTELAELRAENAEIRTEQAEARTELAEARAEHAETRTEQAKTRTESAEVRAEHAETRTEQAKTRTESAEVRAERAETRTEEAKTRTESAEVRAEHAEARAEQVETTLELADQTKIDSSPALSEKLVSSIPVDGPADQKNLLAQLTSRQREILRLIAQGETTKQIGDVLELSPKTVEYHRMKLMNCLNVHDVPGLVRFALRVGLVPADS